MAVYVYVTATGKLYSYCPNDTDPIAPANVLTANGLTALTGQPALDSTHQWSAASKTVVTVAAPAATNFVTPAYFVNCFTSAEMAAIRASADNLISRFMFALGMQSQIDLNGAGVSGIATRMTNQGLLAAGRQAQIIAGALQVT